MNNEIKNELNDSDIITFIVKRNNKNTEQLEENSTINASYYQQNREKRIEYQKNYSKHNPNYQKEYYEKNKSELLKKNRLHNELNKAHIKNQRQQKRKIEKEAKHKLKLEQLQKNVNT